MNRLTFFNGDAKPAWAPSIKIQIDHRSTSKIYLRPSALPSQFNEYFYVSDGFIDQKSCQNLISEFDLQATHPVGVSGYGHISDSEIGSFRTNAWSVDLAEQISLGLNAVLSEESSLQPTTDGSESVFQNCKKELQRMPMNPHTYSLLGSTPFMRFMKYPGGGRHVPHYDAPFTSTQQRYTTLMSWVIYLNTPSGNGGEFQFIDDHQWHLSPWKKNKSDWTRMAEKEEVLASIKPQEGKLLIFPHWLAHQVALYTSNTSAWRYIIRGDVAYGF